METSVSRRKFVVGAAGIAAMSMFWGQSTFSIGDEAPASEASEIPYDQHRDADLIIVGAGCAGLSAAVAAVEAGAQNVVVLESTNRTGGSLALTNGSIAAAETIVQENEGIDDSIEDFVADVIRIGSAHDGEVNEDLVRAYCSEDKEVFQWLWDHGLSEYEFLKDSNGNIAQLAPEHELYSVPRTYKVVTCQDSDKYLTAPHEILDTYVQGIDSIEILFNTTAIELVPNNKGQVTGVVAVDSDGNTTLYRGSHGVIMCTGGYGANPKLLGKYITNGEHFLTGGGSWSNGRGLQMMQKMGGTVVHMDYVPHGSVGLESRDNPGYGIIAPTYSFRAGGICVNKEGKRFMNENVGPTAHEEATAEQTDAMRFDVFTDKIIEDLRTAGNAILYDIYYSSPKAKGYSSMLIADSLEELAKKMDVPVDAFIKTVEDYNAAVDQGGVDEFGRTYDDELATYKFANNKIEDGPFYAVPLHNLVVMTLGGIACNTDLNVIDEDGKAIAGLYAAGEVMGGVWGRQPSSACGTMGSIVFGRLAGGQCQTDTLPENRKIKAAAEVFDDALFDSDHKSTKEYEVYANLADGMYTAIVDGQEGLLEITATIENGELVDLQVVDEHETPAIGGVAIPELIERAVVAGGPNIDGISGATLTSNRVRDAVANCLEQAACA